jgi:hypothetical protein
MERPLDLRGAYPAPCFVHGPWVDVATRHAIDIHQQETWFAASSPWFPPGGLVSATISPDLSVESSTPGGEIRRGQLERAPGAQTWPPLCNALRFADNATWCRPGTKLALRAGALLECPSAVPSPPPPPPAPSLPFRPYPPLTGRALGNYSRLPGSQLSPDPLVLHRWPDDTPYNRMQLHVRAPRSIDAGASAASFDGLDSLVGRVAGGHATVRAPGTLVIDFGAEFAGWVEMVRCRPSSLLSLPT